MSWRIILISFLLISLTLRPPLDLDLGWHLRYGEYFFQNGKVLRENILSYVWPDFKWVQASWGYDLLTYQIFKNFGFFGLSVAASFFSLLIFLVVVYPFRLSFFSLLFLLAVFLTQTDAIFSYGLRSQTPSALFFALMLFLVRRYETEKEKEKKFLKPYYCLPFLFLLWANFHGGVVLGLIILFFICLGEGVLIFSEKRRGEFLGKKWIVFFLITLFSFLATLVNPWGIKLILEGLRHIQNFNVALIEEWKPRFLYPEAVILSGVIFLITLFYFYIRKRKEDLSFFLVYLFLTLLAFFANRFAVNFGIASVLYLAESIPQVRIKILEQKIGKLLFVSIFFLLIFLDIFFFQQYFIFFQKDLLRYSWKDYCAIIRECSEEISEIMKKNPPEGVGIHPYNYGGYLSWRVREVKTFVDGRMAAWEENGRTPPVEEVAQLHTLHAPLVFQKLDKTYHFRWAIVYTPSSLARYLEAKTKFSEWQRIYRDQFFSYYLKR